MNDFLTQYSQNAYYLSTEELMEDSEEGEDWEECEDQTEVSKVTCLFCSMTFTSAEDTFTHCQSAHDLDLIRWSRQHGLDCIQYIKMINYIRLKVSPPPLFESVGEVSYKRS